MSDREDQDALLAQFMGTHDVDPEEATAWLSASNWDLSSASTAYQTHVDENEEGVEEEEEDDAEEESRDRQGSRTLAGGATPGPVETRSGSSRGAPVSKGGPAGKKIATLGDLGSNQPQDDHDDDSDEDHDLFAGGEKSGLAVQNPDDLKRKILEKARRGGARPGGEAPPVPGPSNFRGTARTLGGDDVESQVIEDPSAHVPQPAARVERRLHFWTNGFSVDDGELYDINDPQNAHILQMIRSGRAPLDIMNVSRDQEVDVKVEQHDGPYVPPKRKANPFAGSGQRLGSPTPAVVGSTTATSGPSISVPFASSALPGAPAAAEAALSLDESQPTVSIQIRLGDGTRLVSRFNTSHTITDLYAFVDRSNAESAARPYVLMTTFPSKELRDRGAEIGDTAELKKGGAVVQKWL